MDTSYRVFSISTSVTRCWNKMLPNFSKSYPKSSHNRIFLNSYVFQYSPRTQTIWATFVRKYETENFQKSLNLVTLMFHPRPPFKIIHHLVPLNLTLTFKRRWVDLVDEWLKIGHLASVTVWPDLAKFCHYGKILQVFGKCLMVHLLFDKMLGLFGQICYNIGLISIVSDDQILKNNFSIWSHCSVTLKSKFSPKASFENVKSKDQFNALCFYGKAAFMHFENQSITSSC